MSSVESITINHNIPPIKRSHINKCLLTTIIYKYRYVISYDNNYVLHN